MPVERRSVFLERAAAMLRLRRPFTDDDVADVVRLALCGLVADADSGVTSAVDAPAATARAGRARHSVQKVPPELPPDGPI